MRVNKNHYSTWFEMLEMVINTSEVGSVPCEIDWDEEFRKDDDEDIFSPDRNFDEDNNDHLDFITMETSLNFEGEHEETEHKIFTQEREPLSFSILNQGGMTRPATHTQSRKKS
jgi:hypothetical protein